MRARRTTVLLGVASLVTVGVALAGCSGEPTAGADPADPAPRPETAQGVTVDTAWGHIHTLALDGDRLLLGTHEGLSEQRDGQGVRLLSQPTFDVMGLALDGDRLLASGHPGEGQDLPADFGLRESADGALLRSEDGGTTWTRLGSPPLFDVALDPDDPTYVVATTQDGPVSSTDGGATFAPLPGAPLLALVAWTAQGVSGVAPDGTVHVSADSGATWRQRGSAGGQPSALAADGDRIAVLVGDTVRESTDGGTTFRPRLTSTG